MAELRSRIEVTKLARELEADEAELAYLADAAPEELRDLRRVVSEALHARHAGRVKALASASGLLPLPVAAKISEHALGAALSARVAGAMEPTGAAKLAGHLSPPFLAELAARLDPRQVGPIVALLPDTVVLDVARRLLAAGDLVTLGRFVTVVEPELALTLIDEVGPDALLRLALYVDDAAALRSLVARVPEATVAAALDAASDEEERAAARDLLDGPH